MKKLTIAAVIASSTAGVLLGASPARAQVVPDFSPISVPTPVETKRGPVGSALALGTVSTGASEGSVCTVTAIDNNNRSTHDNDLLVASANTVTIPDIENEAGTGSLKSADGPLTLGSSVTVSVLFQNTDASDNNPGVYPPGTGTFSAQIDVFFDCAPPPTTLPPTTLPPTTLPPTTLPPTTLPPTTLPPTTLPPTTAPPTTGPEELFFEFLAPVCIDDFPFISYSVDGDVEANDRATVTLTDSQGNVVQVLTDQDLTGQVIWPGASVDPPDWPGWVLNDDGVWVEDPTDQVLREDLTITVSVNPEASDTVAYPPATSQCADPSNRRPTTTTTTGPTTSTTEPTTSTDPTPTTTTPGLPVTGSDGTTNSLLIGILLLTAGGSILTAVRRRPS